MEIDSIHSYLVHPGKNLEEQPQVRGTAVDKKGHLFQMMERVFSKAENECHHDIAFLPVQDDKQRNECRDLVLLYIKSRHLADGKKIAERLQQVSTNKSGLGLMFLMQGHDNGITKIVLSRFPADNGILAEEKGKGLTVEFLERVFMKSATAYKAAVYSGRSHDKDFWKGKAIDKQINSSEATISNYWIRDFLKSDFLTPGEAGTRRLAIAVRTAMNRAEDTAAKEEVAALVTILRGFGGKVLSPRQLLEQFQVSDVTKEKIKSGFSKETLFEERFRFVPGEFSKHLAFKTIELSNGGLLTASSERFEDVFKKEPVDGSKTLVRFSTQGNIIDQRFRKTKQ